MTPAPLAAARMAASAVFTERTGVTRTCRARSPARRAPKVQESLGVTAVEAKVEAAE